MHAMETTPAASLDVCYTTFCIKPMRGHRQWFLTPFSYLWERELRLDLYFLTEFAKLLARGAHD